MVDRHRLYLSMALALCVSGGDAIAASDCQLAKIADWPVRLVAGHLVVEGSINGKKVGVALDTGGISSITRPAAVRLGITRLAARGYRVYGVGGESYVESSLVDEFKVGELTRKDWEVTVAGGRDLDPPIDVTLGEDVFSQVDLEFDLHHGRVRLFKPTGCEAIALAYWSPQGASRVDLGQPQKIAVPVKINGQPVAAGQANLGVMYRDGRGVAKDDASAVMWFRRAAEQGNALAQKNLDAMYAQGRVDSKSDAESSKPPLAANKNIERRAEFDVGRVSLRTPDDAWESIGTNRHAFTYTGDRSGEIPLVTRYLLLRDSAGRFRAALVVSASWGVGTVRMTWTQSCRPQKNAHVVDNTRGDVNARDCLRMTGPISTQRYLESAARDIMPELTARNVVLPNTGYAVSDEVGLENGTYLAVQAVFAADFKLPNDGSGPDPLPTGVKPEAVAWGLRLAEAVRSSAHALSGALIVPPVSARAN